MVLPRAVCWPQALAPGVQGGSAACGLLLGAPSPCSLLLLHGAPVWRPPLLGPNSDGGLHTRVLWARLSPGATGQYDGRGSMGPPASQDGTLLRRPPPRLCALMEMARPSSPMEILTRDESHVLSSLSLRSVRWGLLLAGHPEPGPTLGQHIFLFQPVHPRGCSLRGPHGSQMACLWLWAERPSWAA